MKTWNNTDKTSWGGGEWDGEPDKAHWIDEKTGLDCLIVRSSTGALCGYVGVPDNNVNFEKFYESVDVEVHGGLTFADKCHPQEDESKGICHPKEGAANEVVWWLGFDCSHCWDVAPAYDHRNGFMGGFMDDSKTYKNFEYVKYEVSQLAGQLHVRQKTGNES